MPTEKAITLKRLVDIVPADVGIDVVPAFLVEQMVHRGVKVFVRNPKGTIVMEAGFRMRPVSFAAAAAAEVDPTTYRTSKEINDAKIRDRVINYGIEAAGIKFLELIKLQVLDLASVGETRIHWFTGEALSSKVKYGDAGDEVLTVEPPRLRCFRPEADPDEERTRFLWGGALKREPKFTYQFRIHDLFVDELHANILRSGLETREDLDDPFHLYGRAPAIQRIHRAAKKYHCKLRRRTSRNRDEVKTEVLDWLADMPSRSPFKKAYVKTQVFKLIDPDFRWGIGVPDRPPFNAKLLNNSEFRARYKFEKFMAEGFDPLALLIHATLWFLERRNNYDEGFASRPVTRWNLEERLKRYGFSGQDELRTYCELIMWRPEKPTEKREASSKTKTEAVQKKSKKQPLAG